MVGPDANEIMQIRKTLLNINSTFIASVPLKKEAFPNPIRTSTYPKISGSVTYTQI
jgi:hypothetical protein